MDAPPAAPSKFAGPFTWAEPANQEARRRAKRAWCQFEAWEREELERLGRPALLHIAFVASGSPVGNSAETFDWNMNSAAAIDLILEKKAPAGVFFHNETGLRRCRAYGLSAKGLYLRPESRTKRVAESRKGSKSEPGQAAARARREGGVLRTGLPPSQNPQALNRRLKREEGDLEKRKREGDTYAFETGAEFDERIAKERAQKARDGWKCLICDCFARALRGQ
mmetsp:Transcript_16187/g.50070  ORF Transcript_16187/g.50070 Transcript_16187/m.50070 type:complete len:224 (+) Transcript_16187:1520-2191(+)